MAVFLSESTAVKFFTSLSSRTECKAWDVRKEEADSPREEDGFRLGCRDAEWDFLEACNCAAGAASVDAGISDLLRSFFVIDFMEEFAHWKTELFSVSAAAELSRCTGNS